MPAPRWETCTRWSKRPSSGRIGLDTNCCEQIFTGQLNTCSQNAFQTRARSPRGTMDHSLLGYLKALSHPKRFAIVEALSQGDLTFTQVMDKTGIGDSSLLIFHINKLKGIVTRRNGLYSLTPQGQRLYDLILSFQEKAIASRPRQLSLSDRLARLVPGLTQMEEGKWQVGAMISLFFLWSGFCSLLLFLRMPTIGASLHGSTLGRAVSWVFFLSSTANTISVFIFSRREAEGRSTVFVNRHLYTIAGFGWGLPYLLVRRYAKAFVFLLAFSLCALTGLDLFWPALGYLVLLLVQFLDMGRLQASCGESSPVSPPRGASRG